jgi:hypothetical protein
VCVGWGGVQATPWQAVVGGQTISLAKMFLDAGIRVLYGSDVAVGTTKPNSVVGLGELNNAIDRSPYAGWRMTLVLAPWIRFEHGSLHEPLGVMFDFLDLFEEGEPHREGCAVAVRRLEALAKAKNLSFDALCMRTIAHEMGHTFNLRHPPEGQGSSVMHETMDLLERKQLMKEAAFGFAPGDRQWLQQGHEASVRPGGSGFFDADPTDRADTTERGPPGAGLRLRVSTRHDEYLPGEPVFLRLELVNERRRERILRRGPFRETGALRVEIRREADPPVVVRNPVVCCLAGPAARIAADGRLRTNTPIHLGARGLTLTRPGRHEVRALYHDHVDGRAVSVRSDWHAFMIREPDARDGDVVPLLRSAVSAGSLLGMGPGAVQAVLAARASGLRQRAAVHHLLDCAGALSRRHASHDPSVKALELLDLIDERALDREQRLEARVLRAKLDGTANHREGRASVLAGIRELHRELGYTFAATERFVAGIHRDWRRFYRNTQRSEE